MLVEVLSALTLASHAVFDVKVTAVVERLGSTVRLHCTAELVTVKPAVLADTAQTNAAKSTNSRAVLFMFFLDGLWPLCGSCHVNHQSTIFPTCLGFQFVPCLAFAIPCVELDVMIAVGLMSIQ